PVIYTLSLHDALPILESMKSLFNLSLNIISNISSLFDILITSYSLSIYNDNTKGADKSTPNLLFIHKFFNFFFWCKSSHIIYWLDRKSTRLNSSHVSI